METREQVFQRINKPAFRGGSKQMERIRPASETDPIVNTAAQFARIQKECGLKDAALMPAHTEVIQAIADSLPRHGLVHQIRVAIQQGRFKNADKLLKKLPQTPEVVALRIL